MTLFEQLQIKPGITSVIGSGGKTSLLAHLADEAPGTVALTTTTHMFPLSEYPLVLEDDETLLCKVRDRSRAVCIGSVAENGKITMPHTPLSRLAELFDYVIVEADGSKQLPLKAHASWEPVIPEGSQRTVLVIDAIGFGQRIDEAVHRPELFCERASCNPDDPATPERVFDVIRVERELGLIAPDAIVTNMAVQRCACVLSGFSSPIGDIPFFTSKLVRPRQEPLA